MCQCNARIRGTVVKIDRIAIRRHRIATRKYDVLNISMTFVFRFGRKHPGIPSNQTFIRLFQIEEIISQPLGVSIGGGDIPILLASHQAPRRASSMSL